MAVSKETVAWALRMLIGFEATDDSVIEFHRQAYDTLEEIRTSFLRTPQARALFEAANSNTPDQPKPKKLYNIPPFLLRRPPFSNVPWVFEEPTLSKTVSQLCTSEQMAAPEHREICGRLGLGPLDQKRKIWEFVYILAALEQRGKLQPGKRGLGFGTGHEPLPSAFANMGAHIVATDAPADLNFSDAWAQSNQWTNGLEELWIENLVPREAFFERVQFRPADMNAIPTELRDFDFCWSACCLEHLGSIRHGLDFIRNSLVTLKSGGVAVHTTEFNLQSNTDTIEWANLCLFRKRDIELVIHELVQDGHDVEPLNLWPGAMAVDEHIDLPPYSDPHLKLQIADYVTTSIGIIIRKR
jgi:hypothetical protein